MTALRGRCVRRGVRRGRSLEQAAFAVLLRAYPVSLRAEYEAEMADVFRCMRAEAARNGGIRARFALWLRILADTVRSAPVEQWREHRRHGARAAMAAPAPDVRGATIAGAAVFLLYWLTLAPTVAFWDAGEYITVAHVLGIPHPPGNALFVMVARAWDVLLSPAGWSAALRINVLSALCSALAHAFLFLIIERGLRPAGRTLRRVSGACAVLVSASAFTVWHQSNVNEKVYTLSFLTTALVLWLVLRWRDTRNAKLLVAAAYVTALSATNHLMGVLVVPAVLLFVWRTDRGSLLNRRVLAAAVPAVVLALSAQLFLPIRAAQRPVVNEPDPVCASLFDAAVSIYTNGAARGCPALSDALTRAQYPARSVVRDPNDMSQPRGAALVLSQLVNYAQYFDWQWARSVAGKSPLFGGVRPLFTLLVLVLIALGARTHWRHDRAAALLHGAALFMLSVALVAYLNFRWGYSIAREQFPDPALHEVRERDYFFLIGFSFWGVWAGVGIAALWHAARTRVPAMAGLARLAATPILALALVPLALNWSWASRADDWTARDWAHNVLMSVEPYGVLVTNGDNDSFPLWYLQHVEHVREDVTIVLAPYLGMPHYARQVRDLSRACTEEDDPRADRTRIICQRPFARDSIHPRLLAAWGEVRDPPEDSILPFEDADIDRMAATWFTAEQDLELRAGPLHATITRGTSLTPVDTFVAAIVQSTYGERPIHFMTPSPSVTRLGLAPHTVRTGLTWKLREPDDRGLVPMSPDERASTGAWVDLPLTDTLAREIFIVRGRVADPDRPWVDHANYTIPVQYAIMHYAAARAAELAGDGAAAAWHALRLEAWTAL
ncbi:MAG TPA: DUF2723 domain-containing protein [Longimicrobiales bacterium]